MKKSLWWKFIPLLLLGVSAKPEQLCVWLLRNNISLCAHFLLRNQICVFCECLSFSPRSFICQPKWIVLFYTHDLHPTQLRGLFRHSQQLLDTPWRRSMRRAGGRKRHTTTAFKLVMRLVFWILNTLGAPCVSIQSSYNSVSLQLVYLFSGMLLVEMAAGFTIVHKRDLKCKFSGEKFPSLEYFRKNVQTLV